MNLQTQKFETRKSIDEKFIRAYKYGSRVYGCHTEESDYDWIAVVESDDPNLYYSVEFTNTNFTVYSEQNFIKKIQEHHISALECIFQKEDDPFVKYFELDTEKLRRAISSVASNSYVKCKKKLNQGEEYIGLKSMFHSLRILNFGMQIAKYGKIVDYSAANYIQTMVFNLNTNDWEVVNRRFKPIFNAFKTHFKKLAPLDKEEVIRCY